MSLVNVNKFLCYWHRISLPFLQHLLGYQIVLQNQLGMPVGIHVQDKTPVGPPVNHCGHHCLVLKQGQPIRECQTDGHNDTLSLASVCNELKQEL